MSFQNALPSTSLHTHTTHIHSHARTHLSLVHECAQLARVDVGFVCDPLRQVMSEPPEGLRGVDGVKGVLGSQQGGVVAVDWVDEYCRERMKDE
jgi:hypothetical protein